MEVACDSCVSKPGHQAQPGYFVLPLQPLWNFVAVMAAATILGCSSEESRPERARLGGGNVADIHVNHSLFSLVRTWFVN